MPSSSSIVRLATSSVSFICFQFFSVTPIGISSYALTDWTLSSSLTTKIPIRTQHHPSRFVASFVSNHHNNNNNTKRNIISVMKQSSGNNAMNENDYRNQILNSPSAQRNKDPIWMVLKDCLSSMSGNDDDPPHPKEHYNILEVAAGTGVHTTYLANKVIEEFSSATCTWYPTDPDAEARASITGRIQQYYNDNDGQNRLNIKDPQCLTLSKEGPIETSLTLLDNHQMDLIVCINMIHISPWEATIGLFQLGSKQIKAGGILYLYGPYKVYGKTAPTNMVFDNSLKSRDPSWGIRNLEDVIGVAEQHGFKFDKMVEMPVNNWSIIFVKDD